MSLRYLVRIKFDHEVPLYDYLLDAFRFLPMMGCEFCPSSEFVEVGTNVPDSNGCYLGIDAVNFKFPSDVNRPGFRRGSEV